MLPSSWLPADADKMIRMAATYELSGGSISNVIRRCALRLLKQDTPRLDSDILSMAIRRELNKEGRWWFKATALFPGARSVRWLREKRRVGAPTVSFGSICRKFPARIRYWWLGIIPIRSRIWIPVIEARHIAYNVVPTCRTYWMSYTGWLGLIVWEIGIYHPIRNK